MNEITSCLCTVLGCKIGMSTLRCSFLVCVEMLPGFIQPGKARGKGPFHLGHGMSGKVRETCNVHGEMALSYCRSGKTFHF